MSWSDSENYKPTKAPNYKSLFSLCISQFCWVQKFYGGN